MGGWYEIESLRSGVGMHRLHLSGFEYRQEMGCCECGHELSGLINCEEFID
jgi:hypothetical protein